MLGVSIGLLVPGVKNT